MFHKITIYDSVFKEKKYSNKIEVFMQSINDYDRWVICCDIRNEVELREYWEDIVNDVAVGIQPKLDKMISKMNIYMIFFTEILSDYQLKAIIENDRFSVKKVVVNKNMSSITDLSKYIDNKIFKINISKSENESKQTFLEYFNSVDSILFDMFNASEIDERDMDSILLNYLKYLEVQDEN